MTIDTLMLKYGEKSKRIVLNSYGELALKASGIPDEVIGRNMTSDYDVYVGEKGNVDIFGVNTEGALVHIENSATGLTCRPVLESKSKGNKIHSVRAQKINNNFHVFYCVDYEKRLLVHHIAPGDNYTMRPEVLDYIGKRFLYDICADEDGNIHIVYVADDGSLMYKKYVYSSKKYMEPQKICERNIYGVNLVIWEENVYAVLKIAEHNSVKICVCNINTGKLRNGVTLAKIDAKIASYISESRLHIQWEEDSMAFEISCDKELGFVKASPLGKCSGLYWLRAPEGKQKACSCLCNLYNEPFDLNLRDYHKTVQAEYKIKGYQVEEMSQKYIDVLKAKTEEIQRKDFIDTLSRIEASLERLITAVERAFPNGIEEIDNKENDTWTKSE